MAEIDYLNKILETESIAEKIEFKARSERKERVSAAKDEAREFLIKAKNDADAKYKEAINRAREEGAFKLQADREKALSEAKVLSDFAESNKDEAIRRIAGRIVGYCADN